MLARECERVKKKSIAVENVIEMLCCRAIGHTGDKEKPRRLAGLLEMRSERLSEARGA